MMRQYLFIYGVLLSLFVLAGCGGASVPAATAEAVQDTAIPASPTGTPAPAGPQGTFSFTVTGDHETMVSQGSLNYRRTEPASEADDLVRSIFMDSWVGSAYPRYGVTLTIRGEPETGTHTLVQGVIGKYSMEYFRHETSRDNPAYYQRITEGSLTLTSVEGGLLTGTYEFTAQRTLRDENNAVIAVMISGEFENIALDAP